MINDNTLKKGNLVQRTINVTLVCGGSLVQKTFPHRLTYSRIGKRQIELNSQIWIRALADKWQNNVRFFVMVTARLETEPGVLVYKRRDGRSTKTKCAF